MPSIARFAWSTDGYARCAIGVYRPTSRKEIRPSGPSLEAGRSDEFGDAQAAIDLHRAPVAALHLGQLAGRRVAFDQRAAHTTLAEVERQRQPNRPGADDQGPPSRFATALRPPRCDSTVSARERQPGTVPGHGRRSGRTWELNCEMRRQTMQTCHPSRVAGPASREEPRCLFDFGVDARTWSVSRALGRAARGLRSRDHAIEHPERERLARVRRRRDDDPCAREADRGRRRSRPPPRNRPATARPGQPGRRGRRLRAFLRRGCPAPAAARHRRSQLPRPDRPPADPGPPAA